MTKLKLPHPYTEIGRFVDDRKGLYTAEQMQAYAKQARDLALEDAATACDNIEEKRWFGFKNPNTFQDAQHKCAEAIRALKEQP